MASLGEWIRTDLWFWDDRLPLGEGVGHHVTTDGHEEVVVGWSPEGYELAPLWQVPTTTVRPFIADALVRRFGSVEVRVTDDGSRLVGTVLPIPIDANRLGLLDLADGGVEGAPADAPTDQVTLESLAPFPVTVDIANGVLVETTVDLPAGAWPVVAGMHVREGAKEAWVLETTAGLCTLRGVETRVAPITVENLNDREVPAWILAPIAVVLGGVLLAIRYGRRSASQS